MVDTPQSYPWDIGAIIFIQTGPSDTMEAAWVQGMTVPVSLPDSLQDWEGQWTSRLFPDQAQKRKKEEEELIA